MSSRAVLCPGLQLDDRIDEFDDDKQSRRTTLSLSHDQLLVLLFLASLFHFHRGRYVHALPALTQARPADQALWTIVGEAWFTGKTNVSATLLKQGTQTATARFSASRTHDLVRLHATRRRSRSVLRER
jgi:hypothetical protein